MQSWLVSVAFAGMLMCAASADNELRLHISVPKDVAAQAAAQLAGNSQVPSPVLMLHGLEFGANEGFKIEVLAEPEPNSSSSPVLLATTAVVGHPQSTPQPPLQKIDLPVPLNEKAAPFLAGKSDVNLILRFEHTGVGRPPVKIDRAFFASAISN